MVYTQAPWTIETWCSTGTQSPNFPPARTTSATPFALDDVADRGGRSEKCGYCIQHAFPWHAWEVPMNARLLLAAAAALFLAALAGAGRTHSFCPPSSTSTSRSPSRAPLDEDEWTNPHGLGSTWT